MKNIIKNKTSLSKQNFTRNTTKILKTKLFISKRYRYPRSNMSYPTKFEKLTFFEKWINNNVLQLILKSWESNYLFNIFK